MNKTSAIIILAASSYLFFQIPKKQVVNLDGEVILCYKAAEAKQWSLVGKDRYRKLENYLISVAIEQQTVLVSFDPKLSKSDMEKGTSLSSLGLGYEILIDRRTRTVLKVSTIP